MDVQTTEKGMAIVEELLREFAKERKKIKVANGNQEEEELAALKLLVNEYRERAENDPWIQKALESL
jgi:type IV secretory pathway VirB4 component